LTEAAELLSLRSGAPRAAARHATNDMIEKFEAQTVSGRPLTPNRLIGRK
jgi:hypothetical protein